jgi:hypothetical protein
MKERGYIRATDEQRRHLLRLIYEGLTVKQAAAEAGVNFENAKTIYRVMKKEQRVEMKTYRVRPKRGETKQEATERREREVILESIRNLPGFSRELIRKTLKLNNSGKAKKAPLMSNLELKPKAMSQPEPLTNVANFPQQF